MRGIPSALLPRLLALVLCALPLAGCGDDDATPVEDTKPKKSAEELAREREQVRIEQLRMRVKRAKQMVEQYPEEFDAHIQNLEGLAFEAQGTVLESDLKRALEEQRQARETHAKNRLDQIVEQVDALVKDGDYFAAEDLLDQFDPDGSYTETAAYADFEEKLEWVKIAFDAENEHSRITKRARAYHRQGGLEDLAKAIGLLESYPDAYSETQYYAEIREMIDEYFTEYREEKSKIAAVENVPWTEFEIDEYLSSFRSYAADDAEVWTASDGVAMGDNSTDSIAQIEIGEDTWTSYRVDFEVKVPAGQELHVGVTFMQRMGSDQKQYDVESFEPDGSGWVHLLVEFKNGRVEISDLDSYETLVEPYTPRTAGEGGVALFLKPGEEIEIRNVKAQVLSKLETPGEDEGGSDDEG